MYYHYIRMIIRSEISGVLENFHFESNIFQLRINFNIFLWGIDDLKYILLQKNLDFINNMTDFLICLYSMQLIQIKKVFLIIEWLRS